MKKRRLVIVHFNDLNGYPPAVNLVEYIKASLPDWDVTIITTRSARIPLVLKNDNIPVFYVVKFNRAVSRLQRAMKYFWFNLFTLIRLIRIKPGIIFYFESISAFGPCIYKKYLARRSHIMVHYHEYVSPQEYRQGMALVRKLHRLEMPLYPSFDWISHTNGARMALFLKDIQQPEGVNSYLLPNYPPEAWQERASKQKRLDDDRVAMVYVGALSLESMYVKELFDFVAGKEKDYLLDVFSITYDPDVIAYLERLKANNIRFLGPLHYDRIPEKLPAYDVGLILYKGTTTNFNLNAPNKFFEYLVCGNNVIYPVQMEGMKPFENRDGYPKVIGVDFGRLEFLSEFNLHRTDRPFSSEFTAENIYLEVVRHLASMA